LYDRQKEEAKKILNDFIGNDIRTTIEKYLSTNKLE
jgi:hypothetical protein